MSFSGSSMIHNDTFLMQTFFKLWHVSKRFIQNLTICISFLQNLTIVNFLTSSFAFRRSSENSENVVSGSNVFQYVFFECWFLWILKRFGRFFQNFETFQIFFPNIEAVKFLMQNHAFRRSTKNWKYVVFTM